VINTAKTGFEDAAEIIAHAALRHQKEFLRGQKGLLAA
jgi:hypothetical protein